MDRLRNLDKTKLKFSALDPNKVFREEMRVLRSSLFKEQEANRAQEVIRKQELAIVKQQLMKQAQLDIKEFKLQNRIHVLTDPILTASLESEKLQKPAIKNGQQRLKNYMKTVSNSSRSRKEHLTSLFYMAADFVTYKNLDQKIDDALSNFIIPITEKIVDLDEPTDLIQENVIKSASRAVELKNALNGLRQDGKPNVESVETMFTEKTKKQLSRK